MAESLEALNDKWYHILEERQSKLLDAEHDNQDDENHSSLYLGYYQEIMDGIIEGSFFHSTDTELTDQAIDKKIRQRLDELHQIESEDHEQYTSSLQKSYGSYNSESEGELDGSDVYKGPVEYTDDEVHHETASPQKQRTTIQLHSDEEHTNTKPTISSTQQQQNTSNTKLNIKYIGSETKKMALGANRNSNQLEEQQQRQRQLLQKTQENQKRNEGEPNDKLKDAKLKSEIMEKKDERTRETRLLERINKAVDHRITHGPKSKGKLKGGCGGSNSEEGWFSWLNCGVDDRDGDSD
jgi:hypothetical protein